MSEELVLLKEYVRALGLDAKKATVADLDNLESSLRNSGEFGLARLIADLSGPEELLEYVGEEE